MSEYEDDRSNWVPVAFFGPILLAVAGIVCVAVVTALPAWGIGLLTAAVGVAFGALVYAHGQYLRTQTERWRQEAAQPDATIEEALKGLYDSKVRGVLLTLPVTGMMFSAPILIILGLSIAAAGVLT